MHFNTINMSGRQYGKLKVLNNYKRQNRRILWLCQCECGNQKWIDGTILRTGQRDSCGCMSGYHGLHNTRLYSVWGNMKYRCNTSTCDAYENYGGRGIKVCDEWNEDFVKFYDWAINNGYRDGLTIDRIDNDGNYEPNNCRWITKSKNTSLANERQVRRRADKGTYYGISPEKNYYQFDNASEFARNHKLNPSLIRDMANKRKYRSNTYKGWIFGFVKEGVKYEI